MANTTVTRLVYGECTFTPNSENQYKCWKNKERAGTEIHEMLSLMLANYDFDFKTHLRNNPLTFPVWWYYRRLIYVTNLLIHLNYKMWRSEVEMIVYYQDKKLHGICDMVIESDHYIYIIEWKTSFHTDKLRGYKKQVNFYANMYYTVVSPMKPIICMVVCLTETPRRYAFPLTTLEGMTPVEGQEIALLGKGGIDPSCEALMSLI